MEKKIRSALCWSLKIISSLTFFVIFNMFELFFWKIYIGKYRNIGSNMANFKHGRKFKLSICVYLALRSPL